MSSRGFVVGVAVEYLPIDGLPEFRAETTKLILGKGSKAIKEGRVACCQSLSGTGALRLAAEFIAVNLGKDRRVFVSDPTWVRPPPTRCVWRTDPTLKHL